MGLRDRFKKVLGQDKKEEKTTHNQSDIIQEEPVRFRPELKSGNVLFVCETNHFISQAAEAIFNSKVPGRKAYSAGVFVTGSGSSLPYRAIEIASGDGIDLSLCQVSGIDDYDLDEGVLILTSTLHIRDFLKESYQNFEIFTINEYAGFSNPDIENPDGTDLSVWPLRFDEVKKAVNKIVEIHFDTKTQDMPSVCGQNFRYLDYLIHSEAAEIVLDCDITLDEMEEVIYENGIPLDVSDITLNGNGHKIDARGRIKIFNITGCNVTLRNIVFANGFEAKSFVGGGALKNHSKNNSCIDCRFVYNSSSRGGAVYNDENAELSISHCHFLENKSEFSGAAIQNHGKLDVDESYFTDNYVENGNGGAIFNHSTANINHTTFKANRALNDGYGYDDGGGAIYNHSGKLIIRHSIFADNYSDQDGGAILNLMDCDVLIDNSSFCRNRAQKQGSTIFNKGQFRIENSRFHKDSSIANTMGNLKIFNSNFVANISQYLISNQDQLEIGGCIFEENDADTCIENYKNLTVFSGNFINNNLKRSVIFNDGTHCHLEKTNFENNDPLNIFNQKNLTLNDIKIAEDKISIFNSGKIIYKSVAIENVIENHGTVDYEKDYENDDSNFTSLDDLIHTSQNRKIVLENDFSFKDYEKDFFEGGIDLDIDELVIDGNNHIIDGGGLSRIFVVTARNVTLKNIIFKNGFSNKNYDNPLNNHGGAIRNNFSGNLEIIDCRFQKNSCEENGGAISNNGKLIIRHFNFSDCKANYGGAVNNLGKLFLYDGEFLQNHGNYGGAVYNKSEIELSTSLFVNNSAVTYGGAIYNCPDAHMEIKEGCFKDNTITTKHALVCGGAIFNDGDIKIDDTSFIGNVIYEGRGPAIFNQSGTTAENNCIFEKNWVLDKDED